MVFIFNYNLEEEEVENVYILCIISHRYVDKSEDAFLWVHHVNDLIINNNHNILHATTISIIGVSSSISVVKSIIAVVVILV